MKSSFFTYSFSFNFGKELLMKRNSLLFFQRKQYKNYSSIITRKSVNFYINSKNSRNIRNFCSSGSSSSNKTDFNSIKQKKKTCYYKILNLSVDASKEEIKKSYYKLAKESHPDLETEKETETENVREVFQLILNHFFYNY